jgi:hypothetical protein
MSLKKTIMRGAAALAAVSAIGAAGIAAATPAEAATGWARCPKGDLCVFTGKNGTGTMATYKKGDYNLGDKTGPRGMNNNIESVWNRGNHYFLLWGKPGYKGADASAFPGSKGNTRPKFTNWASSIELLR